MKLDVRALTLAVGLFWGAAIFIVASANLMWPSYGRAFLDVAASLYPGYHPTAGIGSVIMATLYAFVDGAISGAVFGWIYNLFAGRHPGQTA